MDSKHFAGEKQGTQTFEKIFTSLCKRLTDINKVHEISQQFLDTKSDEKRVENAYRHLSEQGMLPFKENKGKSSRKSSAVSVQMRNDGNKIFGKVNADLKTALMIYTRSIAAAPFPGDQDECAGELALAFANRSAVLFAMGKYQECLSDIEQALLNNYPDKLKHKVLERRAKCYKQLGQIDKARKIYQEALSSGLPCDKAEAIRLSLQQMDIEDHEPARETHVVGGVKRLPGKSFGKNQEVPCASDCMAIKHNSSMGRYIEACKDINPGDVLLIEEPYASCIQPKYYSSHCYNCLLRFAALIPCKSCDLAMFCSENCRTASWKKSHEMECPLLPHLLQLDMGKVWLLALRIIITTTKKFESLENFQAEINLLEQKKFDERTKGFSENGLYESDSYSAIHFLVGNTDSRSVSDLFKRATKAACILNCLAVHSSLFSPKKESIENQDMKFFVGGLLLRYLQSLPCNAHSITDLKMQGSEPIPVSTDFGSGAYATLSLINHSCDPNVTRSNFRGDLAILMAVRPIKKGEQIMDNYGFHYAMQECEQRITGLKTQYYFTCQCDPCTDDWPLYYHIPATNPKLICDNCRAILPPINASTASGCNIVKCKECKRDSNVYEMLEKIKLVAIKFNNIYEKLLAGSNVDFIRELSDHLITLDRMIVRPWRLFNDCQEAMKECFMRKGNFYN